jgi:hypothetical protein
LAVIVDCDETEFSELFEEMLDLPEHDLALAAPLPPILTPGIQRLARAVAVADGDEVENAVQAALAAFDTPATGEYSSWIAGLCRGPGVIATVD